MTLQVLDIGHGSAYKAEMDNPCALYVGTRYASTSRKITTPCMLGTNKTSKICCLSMDSLPPWSWCCPSPLGCWPGSYHSNNWPEQQHLVLGHETILPGIAFVRPSFLPTQTPRHWVHSLVVPTLESLWLMEFGFPNTWLAFLPLPWWSLGHDSWPLTATNLLENTALKWSMGRLDISLAPYHHHMNNTILSLVSSWLNANWSHNFVSTRMQCPPLFDRSSFSHCIECLNHLCTKGMKHKEKCCHKLWISTIPFLPDVMKFYKLQQL